MHPPFLSRTQGHTMEQAKEIDAMQKEFKDVLEFQIKSLRKVAEQHKFDVVMFATKSITSGDVDGAQMYRLNAWHDENTNEQILHILMMVDSILSCVEASQLAWARFGKVMCTVREDLGANGSNSTLDQMAAMAAAAILKTRDRGEQPTLKEMLEAVEKLQRLHETMDTDVRPGGTFKCACTPRRLEIDPFFDSDGHLSVSVEHMDGSEGVFLTREQVATVRDSLTALLRDDATFTD